jgi:hypothetical protein
MPRAAPIILSETAAPSPRNLPLETAYFVCVFRKA